MPMSFHTDTPPLVTFGCRFCGFLVTLHNNTDFYRSHRRAVVPDVCYPGGFKAVGTDPLWLLDDLQ